MSRIGKKPIVLPTGVTAEVTNGMLTVSGPKGKLSLPVHGDVELTLEADSIVVSVPKPEVKQQKALWGLFRSLVQNLVTGVTAGFEKKLEVNGVGFKVAVAGKVLQMQLGFSHPVNVDIPADLEVTVEKNIISVKGSDKQHVGQFAANVRALKKPEPYKGKGIKYEGEVILRKAGKVVKAVGK